MKKVLFFTGSLRGGGAERQMVNLAVLLKEKGYDISFFCLTQEGAIYKNTLSESKININFSVHEFKGRGKVETLLYMLKMVKEFKGHMKLNRFDIVISFHDYCNFIASVARKKQKFLLLAGERSSSEESFVSLLGKFYNHYCRYADYIICNSENAKEMWLRYYPKYQKKLKTIYNIVLLGKICSNYAIKKDGKLLVIVAASIQQIKNPIGLIMALSLMNEQERSLIKVDWYGSVLSENLYREAIALIEKFHLQKVISFKKSTSKIYDKMNEADAIALFSHVEGLPNAICEGMALAKPILMTRVSDYSVLVDKTNGFLCDSEDVESIKEALLSITRIPNEGLVEMGKMSRLKTEKLFDPSVIVNNWVSLFS